MHAKGKNATEPLDDIGTADRDSEADGYLVFVSHASADKWVAVQMSKRIESKSASVFRDDRDIDGGDDIPDEILRAIGRSQEVVVLLTPQSTNRDWLKLEIGAAWGLRKRIVLILYQIDSDPLPATFARRKAIQLNDFDDYLDELAKRIGDDR
jgi:hypothetical protein